MNVLDIGVIVIVLACVVFCYVKGLLMAVFNLLSLFISFLLTRELYPHVSAVLRETPLFDAINGIVSGWMGQGAAVDSGQAVADAVGGMALPEMFKDLVMNNMDNMPSLDMSGVYDYVSSFAAGIAVDAISILLVFVAVFLLMRVIGLLLKMVSKMPVIKTFNHLGGGLLGLLAGSIISWLTLSVLNGLFAASTDFPVADLLAESLVAKFFMFNL